MNRSKTRDPRFWYKWESSGAVENIEKAYARNHPSMFRLAERLDNMITQSFENEKSTRITPYNLEYLENLDPSELQKLQSDYKDQLERLKRKIDKLDE